MLTNKRIRLSIVPMLIGIIAALISAEFALIGLSSIAITALIIAVSLILMSSLARRKSSSPFERILMLNPRDERESKQIERGFGLVGKITLALVFVFSVSMMIFNGYAYFTKDMPFEDCTVPNGTNNLICTPNTLYYFSYSAVYLLVIFGVVGAISSAIAMTRKV